MKRKPISQAQLSKIVKGITDGMKATPGGGMNRSQAIDYINNMLLGLNTQYTFETMITTTQRFNLKTHRFSYQYVITIWTKHSVENPETDGRKTISAPINIKTTSLTRAALALITLFKAVQNL